MDNWSSRNALIEISDPILAAHGPCSLFPKHPIRIGVHYATFVRLTPQEAIDLKDKLTNAISLCQVSAQETAVPSAE